MNPAPRIWYSILVIIAAASVLVWFVHLLKERIDGDTKAPDIAISGTVIAMCAIVLLIMFKKIVRRSKRQYPY